MPSQHLRSVVAALAITTGSVNAGEKWPSYEDLTAPVTPSIIAYSKARALEICEIHPGEHEELCNELKKLDKGAEPAISGQQEISADRGETWVSLEQALLLGGWTLAAGALGAGGLMIRNRRRNGMRNDRKTVASTRQEPSFPSGTIQTDSSPSLSAEIPNGTESEEMLLVKPWSTYTTKKIPLRSDRYSGSERKSPGKKSINIHTDHTENKDVWIDGTWKTPVPESASDTPLSSGDVSMIPKEPVQTPDGKEPPTEANGSGKKLETRIITPSNFEQSLLEKNLQSINEDHKKTLDGLVTICGQLRKFIDSLPDFGNQYTSELRYPCFFGKSLHIFAKKTSSREPYTYSFELTLYGMKRIYATKESFTDLESIRQFIHEKIQEEYDFRRDGMIRRFNHS